MDISIRATEKIYISVHMCQPKDIELKEIPPLPFTNIVREIEIAGITITFFKEIGS